MITQNGMGIPRGDSINTWINALAGDATSSCFGGRFGTFPKRGSIRFLSAFFFIRTVSPTDPFFLFFKAHKKQPNVDHSEVCSVFSLPFLLVMADVPFEELLVCVWVCAREREKERTRDRQRKREMTDGRRRER